MSLPGNFLASFASHASGNPEAALAFLFPWAAKATALLAAAWIVASAFRRRSAALRHRVWTIGVLGSLALPFLGPILPVWRSGLLGRVMRLWSPQPATVTSATLQMVSSDSTTATSSAMARSSHVSLHELAILLLALWAAGAFLIALRLAVGIARMAWLGRQSKPLFDEEWTLTLAQLCQAFGIRRPVRLLECTIPAAMPGTWGVLRPQIMLPSGAAEWTEERRRIVLSHELAHIRRHDWLLQVCAEVLRAALCFHPLAWIAAGRLRQESEHACDDSVLNSGVEAAEYASQLLTLARLLKSPEREFSVALAIARPSKLEKRFTAMLNPSIERRPLSTKAAVLAVLLGAMLLLPLAALRAPAATPRIEPQVAVETTLTEKPGLSAENESAPPAKAPQNAGGSITGTVYDESGAAIAGALVTLTTAGTGAMQQTRSDGRGDFSFEGLPAGEYAAVIEASGFKKYTAAQILLSGGRTVSLSPALQVGTIQQTVTVETNRSNAPFAPYSPTAQTSVPACVANAPGAKPPAGNGAALSLRAGGQVMAARLINQVPPVYPSAAKAAGIEGSVALRAVLGTDGAIQSLCWLNSDKVDASLAQSAYDAVGQWRYQPTTLNGQPVEVDTTITVTFEIGDRAGQNNAPGQAPNQPGASAGGSEPRGPSNVATLPAVAGTFVPGKNGVGFPRCVHCPEPQYSQEARDAHIQGTVILHTVIGPDGLPSQIEVVSGPGFSLEQQAIEAVKTWRFHPALAPDGTPVATTTPIEVTFRLLR